MIPLYDDSPTHRFPFVTVVFIAVNVAVYFLWQTRIALGMQIVSRAIISRSAGAELIFVFRRKAVEPAR